MGLLFRPQTPQAAPHGPAHLRKVKGVALIAGPGDPRAGAVRGANATAGQARPGVPAVVR